MNLPTVKDKPNSMLTGVSNGKSAFSPRHGMQSQALPLAQANYQPEESYKSQAEYHPQVNYQSQVDYPSQIAAQQNRDVPDFHDWRRMRSDNPSKPLRRDDSHSNSSPKKLVVPGKLNQSPLIIASFTLLFGLLLIGGFAYSQITQTIPQTPGSVAGVATNTETFDQQSADQIISKVKAAAQVDLNDTPSFSKVVSADAARKQNPVFFAKVQEGDLLIKFQQYAALYRPSSKEIIAQGSLRVN